MLTQLAALFSSLVAVQVQSQHIDLQLDPPNHHAAVQATLQLDGVGELRLRLSNRAENLEIRCGGRELGAASSVPDQDGDTRVITLPIEQPQSSITLSYQARFEQDITKGERPGQIHNFSVDAHVGPVGVFLSDGSAWHPVPLDDDGFAALELMSIDIQPIEGMALAATGEPVASDEPITTPRWKWATPRPVDGMAVAGGPHQLAGRVHSTIRGPVEVVMLSSKDNAAMAPIFLDAACRYLDLYVPLLGAFPYKRFTIVENFFSSGFAYPGFTLLSSQVVKMGERALAPGYLDHELCHNWWGNGVYVDPRDGNWCEALTSYCANYGRRLLGEGAEAAKTYRRDVLMRLTSNPDGLDNAPLGDFGRRGAPVNPDRFVGYEKGTFFFIMLEDTFRTHSAEASRARWWKTLRTFAEQRLGRRTSWDDLRAVVEAEYGQSRSAFFETWLRKHAVPVTGTDGAAAVQALASQVADGQGVESFESSNDAGHWIEVDPDFRIYRVLPQQQLIPTLAGTTGPGGVRIVAMSDRKEVADYLANAKSSEDGENLLIIGREAASLTETTDLLRRAVDSISFTADSFTVAGKTYDQPTQSVLHTMQHPDHPGRWITVFLANGEAGWSRLRLINFYTRDTTVIWDSDKVAERRVYEPDRRLRR